MGLALMSVSYKRLFSYISLLFFLIILPHLLATVFPIFFKNVRLILVRIMCHVFFNYKNRTYISYYWFDFSNMFSISFFEIGLHTTTIFPPLCITTTAHHQH